METYHEWLANNPPNSEDIALSRLSSFSNDPLLTTLATKDFHTRRALGESIESAYRGALELMIRRAG